MGCTSSPSNIEDYDEDENSYKNGGSLNKEDNEEDENFKDFEEIGSN